MPMLVPSGKMVNVLYIYIFVAHIKVLKVFKIRGGRGWRKLLMVRIIARVNLYERQQRTMFCQGSWEAI